MADNIELIQKILALAEEGVDGEKENARAMLEKLMRKYGIAEADLSNYKLEMHEFYYHGEWEKRLLFHTIKKVAPDRETYRYTEGTGSRTTILCRCTKEEALRIQIEHEFYAVLWVEELENFFLAFIAKHRIFDPRPKDCTPKELDPERLRRIQQMMAGMQDREPTPRIEEATGAGN